uniref:Lipocalin n=1 Tax=Rhipicephalus appendiculatus TaxID=34631 RepID=A0A131YQJ6_RHIAP
MGITSIYTILLAGFAATLITADYEPVYKTVHIVKPNLPPRKKLTGHSANVRYAFYYTGNICKEPNPFVPLHTEPYVNRTTMEPLTLHYRCIGGFMNPVVCGYRYKPITDLCILFERRCWQIMVDTPTDLMDIFNRRKKLAKCIGRDFEG